MTTPSNIRIAAICPALLCFQCGALQRDNPLHPSASQPGNGEETTLSFVIPLPKALAGIVHRIFARLEAPGMQRSSRSSTTRLWGLRRSSSAPSPQVRDVLYSSRLRHRWKAHHDRGGAEHRGRRGRHHARLHLSATCRVREGQRQLRQSLTPPRPWPS